jgi:ribose-phosphate pyrophosphokinase
MSSYKSVRGCNVYLIQPTSPPANENVMELQIMIDACRRASAKNITAVIPYFGYARADRKASVLYVTLLHGIHDSLSRWFITFYV